MTKIDPIIAVKDVESSVQWYQQVFDFQNAHGGKHFAVMCDEYETVMLCLHKWEAHHHPTLSNQNIPSGNGLLLYFKTDDIHKIRNKLEKVNWPIAEELHLNQNSLKNEFSFRDPDGYFITVTAYHEYEG